MIWDDLQAPGFLVRADINRDEGQVGLSLMVSKAYCCAEIALVWGR